MIHLLAPDSGDAAAQVVFAALQRSCGQEQVRRISPAHPSVQARDAAAILVAINPPDDWSALLIRGMQSARGKVVVFGALPPMLARHLDTRIQATGQREREGARCQPAASGGNAQSPLRVHYAEIDETVRSPLADRSFVRYDFADEWNNLGYGAIRTDDSIWAISQMAELPSANRLASITLEDEHIGAYAGLWKDALLWFNRPVGPVDSHEWRIVEEYLAHCGWPQRACQPVLGEIPDGYDAAVTMRLDCDEDVESARELWQFYRQLGIPFSLALHTSLLDDERHHSLPREVLAQGGAVLSHSATHAANWGGSYAAALSEATQSAERIRKVTGEGVHYAVSPFHQTPDYARTALAKAGYLGCIGGIIRDDPDFLLARSGPAPGSAASFIGHSQQCMLHGDCLLDGADPLTVYRQAFDLARSSRTYFGYSDHPFSERYQYGWLNEQQRLQAHADFIRHMRSCGRVLFANEADALDFLRDRNSVGVRQGPTGFTLQPSPAAQNKWRVTVEYGKQRHCLPIAGMTL